MRIVEIGKENLMPGDWRMSLRVKTIRHDPIAYFSSDMFQERVDDLFNKISAEYDSWMKSQGIYIFPRYRSI